MTFTAHIKEKNITFRAILPFLCVTISFLTLAFGEEIKKGVTSGIGLSFENIIPTLFPFFILSDLWASVMQTKKKGILGKGFEYVFGIDGRAASVFILGSVCGFPLGVKTAVKQYETGIISKYELERLCGFANNPSAAFVIFGVGAGIYRNTSLGLLLYFTVIFSAVITGVIFRASNRNIKNTPDISRQTFDLVDSIKAAGMSSIAVASYIIFFSAVIALVDKLIQNSIISLVISAFLEIASASEMIAKQAESMEIFSLVLAAFALGFSGFSVHLQAFSFMPKEISKKKYLIMKLTQGLICALIFLVLIIITKLQK